SGFFSCTTLPIEYRIDTGLRFGRFSTALLFESIYVSNTRSRCSFGAVAPQCGQTISFETRLDSSSNAASRKTISPAQDAHENTSLQTVYAIRPLVFPSVCSVSYIQPISCSIWSSSCLPALANCSTSNGML